MARLDFGCCISRDISLLLFPKATKKASKDIFNNSVIQTAPAIDFNPELCSQIRDVNIENKDQTQEWGKSLAA